MKLPGQLPRVLPGGQQRQLDDPRPLQGPLGHVPQALHGVHGVRVRVPLRAPAGGGGLVAGQSPIQRVVVRLRPQGRQRLDVRADGGVVVHGAARHPQRLPKLHQRGADGPAGGILELVLPHGQGLVVAPAGPLQPRLRVGTLLQLRKQRLRRRTHAGGPPAVVQLQHGLPGMGPGGGVVLVPGRVPGVGLLQRLVQRLLAHAGHHGVVQYAKRRVDPGGFEVLAQEIRAEGMDGGDAGPIQLQQLFAAADVPRRGPLIEPPGQLGAHVGGRRTGEGHHQHAVHVRALVGDHAKHALHQHRGLARPRRRRKQYAAAPGFDGPPLFIRPLRHGIPPHRYRIDQSFPASRK